VLKTICCILTESSMHIKMDLLIKVLLKKRIYTSQNYEKIYKELEVSSKKNGETTFWEMEKD